MRWPAVLALGLGGLWLTPLHSQDVAARARLLERQGDSAGAMRLFGEASGQSSFTLADSLAHR